MNNQLSKLKDTTLVSQLSLIGTHDSCTYGVKFPFKFTSRCQRLTLEEQLAIGVRYFDIRLNLVKGQLMAYHGLACCHISWVEIQRIFERFLAENPKEIVFVRILRADDIFKTKTTDEEWIEALGDDMSGTYRSCFSDTPIGDLRGKTACVNLMWQWMFPYYENKDYRYWSTKMGIARKISSISALQDIHTPGRLNIINFNSRGSIGCLPIPYPEGFASKLSKEITELKGTAPVWYMFDFPELFEHLFEGILSRNDKYKEQ